MISLGGGWGWGWGGEAEAGGGSNANEATYDAGGEPEEPKEPEEPQETCSMRTCPGLYNPRIYIYIYIERN